MSRQVTAAVTASFSSNVFTFRSLAKVLFMSGNAINPCVLNYGIGGLVAGEIGRAHV